MGEGEVDVFRQVSNYFRGERTIEQQNAIEQACTTDEILRAVYYDQWVSAYLSQRLRDDETERFRTEVTSNEMLNSLLQEHQSAIQSVDQQVADELRKHFAEWKQEGKQETKNYFIPWGIAASFVLLLSSYLLFFNRSDLSSEAVALKYYQLPQAPGGSMGEADVLWSAGVGGFEQSDFMTAILKWEQITDKSAEQRYYLAHAYFNKQEYVRASAFFADLSAGTSAYSFSADWYLLLCAISIDNQVFFRQSKARLSNERHPFNQDFEQLMSDLE